MTKPATPPVPDMRDSIEAKIVEVTTARNNVRMQLNGLENQLYILNELLTPTPAPEPVPDAKEAPPEKPPDGMDVPKGSI